VVRIPLREGALGHREKLFESYFVHRPALVSAAARIVGCRSQAEDVVQDAYLRLSERTLGGDIRQPLAYLFRLVRNLAIDRARRLKLELRHGAAEEVPLSLPSSEASPEDVAVAESTLRRIEAALTTLPERTRLVFEMSRVGGLSAPEIAALLGIGASTVYEHLSQAMTHCRACLLEDDGGGGDA
jgi:RNA polymerase sigma-70 factor (ECF subfamily)